MGEFSHLSDSILVLLLILVANGTPLLIGKMFNDRFNQPVDFGIYLSDGYPLFGCSKTWRGIFAATLVTLALSVSLGLTPLVGLLIGLSAMIGDLLSSFFKRRMAIEPSGMFTGVDQVPESLLPALAVKTLLGLHWPDILMIVLSFVLLNRLLSIALFKLHIRSEPY